eukprot:TRINITY_DN9403_c0_g1_i1.p1 TRINITY_DN9403_c0_g1~~TRINITY_DN9403_c0_g1_i1.p1  ORF type:complete len:314 (+),score=51.35 TRINITY_DN9403_c0_g1_i1:180-1121(+)
MGSGTNKNARDDSIVGKASEGKIFIGGLSRDTTTEKMTEHFKKYGEIIDAVIMKDRVTGFPRGFGFVTYADPSVVDAVMKDTHTLDGREVEIKRSIPRENMDLLKGPKTKKVFVGGLLPSIKKEELEKYFRKYGNVVDAQILENRNTGEPRGFGFVTFDIEQTVDDLLALGQIHKLGGKQVEVKKAEPKGSMQDSRYGRFSLPARDAYRAGPADYSYDDRYGHDAYGPGRYRSYSGRYDSSGYLGDYGEGYASGGYGGAPIRGYMGSSYGGSYDEAYGYMGYPTGGYGGGYAPSGVGGYSSGRSSGRYHPYAR